MELTRFHNKDGSLTAYSFACGYIQHRTINGITVSLFKNGCWHVQVRTNARGRYVWECFDTLGKARSAYAKQLVIAKKGITQWT